MAATASSSSPSGTAGGRRAPVRASAPGVEDDEVLRRGAHRVEEQLAVFAARVALADAGGAGEDVVAVVHPARGNAPSSRPSRQITRCGTERIGTIVATVRVPVRKFARPGRPRSRSASSPGRRRGRAARPPAWRPPGRPRCRIRELGARAWPVCHASAGVVAVSASRASVSPVIHAASGRSPERSASAAESRSTNSARRPSRSTSPDSTSSSGSAVPSQLPPSMATPSRSRSSPAAQVFCGNFVEPVRAAVRGGQPPPHAGPGDEVAQPVEVVAVEAEAAADGSRGEQVEHLGGGQPGVGQLQQAAHDVEQRVHLS